MRWIVSQQPHVERLMDILTAAIRLLLMTLWRRAHRTGFTWKRPLKRIALPVLQRQVDSFQRAVPRQLLAVPFHIHIHIHIPAHFVQRPPTQQPRNHFTLRRAFQRRPASKPPFAVDFFITSPPSTGIITDSCPKKLGPLSTDDPASLFLFANVGSYPGRERCL